MGYAGQFVCSEGARQGFSHRQGDDKFFDASVKILICGHQFHPMESAKTKVLSVICVKTHILVWIQNPGSSRTWRM